MTMQNDPKNKTEDQQDEPLAEVEPTEEEFDTSGEEEDPEKEEEGKETSY